MKTEIIINGVEYNLDLEKAKELGVIKEKDTRCKSWEEFRNKYQKKQGYYYDDYNTKIEQGYNPISTEEQLTENEAIAIKIFSKLLKLRRDWIGTWEPNWCNSMENKYYIAVYRNEFYVNYCSEYSKTFSFPTKEMAKEFLKCFEDLFNQYKNIM